MRGGSAGTAMLAVVTGPHEAEIALAGGADIIHLDGGSAQPSTELIAATVAAVSGRARVTVAIANTGPGPQPPGESLEAILSRVDAIMVPVRLDGSAPEVIRAAALPSPARLIAVLEAAGEAELVGPLVDLAKAGFQGVLLNVRNEGGGRLFTRLSPSALAAFVHTVREHGLSVGVSGDLEAPDVPRLLALRPDFVGFRAALRTSGSPTAELDLAAVRAIRALIPATAEKRAEAAPPILDTEPESDQLPEITERIFVRDFVLPVRIGAYRHEHAAPQSVRFDVCVEVQRARRAPQGMAQVFSYDLITDGIKGIVAEGHVELVETLADRIAALVLRHERATRVTVRVEKLDVGPGGVGVEVVVGRPNTKGALEALLATLEEGAPKRP